MAEQERHYEGVGGWLVLPMIGLMLMSVEMSVTIYADLLPLIAKEDWSLTPKSPSAANESLTDSLITFELVRNIVFIALSLVILVLMFMRLRLARTLLIGYLILILVLMASDFLWVTMVPQFAAKHPILATQTVDQALKELVLALVAATIGLPYFIISKRVKRTFIR